MASEVSFSPLLAGFSGLADPICAPPVDLRLFQTGRSATKESSIADSSLADNLQTKKDMRKLRCGHIVILTGIFLNALILMLIWQRCGTPTYESVSLVRDEKLLVVDHKSQKEYRYNNDIPIIFIGGVPR